MLGMRRPSPLDHLELERSHSKILKDDALSIYEATLQKLRLGSRRAFAPSMEAMKCDTPSLDPNASPHCSNTSTCSNLVEKDLEDSSLC